MISEGLTVDENEKVRLVEHLGDKATMMILRNHGLLAGGRTIAEAFVNLWLMERSLPDSDIGRSERS